MVLWQRMVSWVECVCFVLGADGCCGEIWCDLIQNSWEGTTAHKCKSDRSRGTQTHG